MIIIVSFVFIIFIRESLKKRNNNTSSSRSNNNNNISVINHPSLLNFLSEFVSSWSIIHSLKSCIASCSYLLNFIFIVSLFLISKPLHFKLFYYLCLLLLYILLPLIEAIITRISFFINYEEREIKNINDNNDYEIISSSNNNKSKYKFKHLMKFIFSFVIDWSEMYLLFITLHLLIEYITFSIYTWLYAAGENSNYRVWIFFVFNYDEFFFMINIYVLFI